MPAASSGFDAEIQRALLEDAAKLRALGVDVADPIFLEDEAEPECGHGGAMKTLRIAPDLRLPADVVTQTLLVVGKRGSGKSNTAARLVEQLHAVKIPFVVLDPVDTWWGLKAGRDGGPGLEGIYVFGGKHADLPLEPGDRSGALIAEVLCEHQLSMVLSVKHLSGRERSAFMVAFAQTLFQKWAGGPLHVVLEEAHELAPQNTQNAKEGEQQMLGAFKRLWKLGRASGIGGTAVTQRPASLSKDITTQSEILVAHRTIGPQDVKAIGEWIKYHGERGDILGELPTLPTGDAYVWGPEFPSEKPIGLRRVSVLLRDTYDSASTPKVGERRIEPKELAPADLDRLRAKMSATIERAKADDPKELRKEIARLKAEIAKSGNTQPAPPDPAVVQQYVDAGVAAAMQAEWKRAREALRVVTGATGDLGQLEDALSSVRHRLDSIRAFLEKEEPPTPAAPPVRHASRVAAPVRPTPPAGASARRPLLAKIESTYGTSNGSLGGIARKIVDAIAFYESVGEQAPTREMVAAFCGVTVGGSFSARISEARTPGYIEDAGAGRLALTEAGRAIADPSRLPKSRQELHDNWRRKLKGKAAQILDLLIEVYPDSITREALAAHVGAVVGGSFSARLSEVRSPGLLVDLPGGEVRASDLLFPPGLS